MPDTDIDIAALLDDPRTAVGSAPVGAGGAGEDIRDTPEFDWLETEFRKMETDGPAAVDWKELNARTFALLETRSKDLILATRLAFGLFREEGYRGLAVGLSILTGMVADHWEGLFPPPRRERGRAGSLDWLAEKLAPLVEAAPPTEETRVFALLAHDRLAALDDLLSQKLQKLQVSLGPLARALRPHAREARAALDAAAETEARAADSPGETSAAGTAETTDTDAVSGSEPAATPAEAPADVRPPPSDPAPGNRPSAPPPPVVPDVPTSGGAEQAFGALFEAATRVATAVRQEAQSDPRTYLCSRFALWGRVSAPPPSNAGKSALPPPQRAKLTEIEAMKDAGNGAGLLTAAEGAFVASPFWLDAQFLVVQAMKGLGPDYDAAQATVTGQLRAFLTRVPGLADLSFNDGTPFASPETANWIASDVQSASGGGNGVELDDTKAKASKLGQAGNVLAGLELLTGYADSRFGERDRFLARLEIGEYCLRHNQLQPLFALVDGMRRTADERALGTWDPHLAVALASLAWRSLAHKGAAAFFDDKALKDRRKQLMETLAGLDIVAAARLGGPAK